MESLILPFIGSLLRHGLTVVGGTMLGTDGVQQVVGAVMTLIGVGLSVYKTYKAQQAAAPADAPAK